MTVENLQLKNGETESVSENRHLLHETLHADAYWDQFGAAPSPAHNQVDAVLAYIKNSDKTKPTGVQPQPVDLNLNEDNVGLRTEQIVGKAIQSLTQNGMTAETKKVFEDAIKVADIGFQPADLAKTQAVLTALKSGTTSDGTRLSSADVMQAHVFVNQEIDSAWKGYKIRALYANSLAGSKQFASAEKMYNENVGIADKLPMPLVRAEIKQLEWDARNPNLNRSNQADLFEAQQQLQGSTSSSPLYEPLIARKVAASFYLRSAAMDDGPLKPEQALKLLDQAKDKANSLYGLDLNASDSAYASLNKAAISLLPDNLRKERAIEKKTSTDAINDATAAGVAFLALGIGGAILTKNPKLATMLMEESSTSLNLAGKATAFAGAATTATAVRHVISDDKDWSTSAIHGIAVTGAAAAVLGTRSLLTPKFFSGATEADAIQRAALEKGVSSTLDGAASGAKDLSAKSLEKIFNSQNLEVPKSLAELVKASPDTLVVQAGKVTEAAPRLGMSEAQSATFAKNLIRSDGSNLAQSIASRINPFESVDLNVATKQQLGGKYFWSGTTNAFAGLGAYNTVTALDRPIDPKTGQPISYQDSIVRNNYHNFYDNTLTQSVLFGALPFVGFKDGALKQTLKTGNIFGTAMKAIISPIRGSYGGALGAEATLSDQAKQAAYLAYSSAFYRNIPSIEKALKMPIGNREEDAMHKEQEKALKMPIGNRVEEVIDKEQEPLNDQIDVTPPVVTPHFKYEIPQLNL